jgi:DNA-binding MarR family transcriptional regulator
VTERKHGNASWAGSQVQFKFVDRKPVPEPMPDQSKNGLAELLVLIEIASRVCIARQELATLTSYTSKALDRVLSRLVDKGRVCRARDHRGVVYSILE